MLSYTEENYLKALFHLTAEKNEREEAGTNELAAHLCVKPATANDMLKKIGLSNIYHNQNRYPQITLEDLMNVKPEVILLSSEPYPFKEKDLAEFKNKLPKTNVILVDGEMFSWYGSRLLKAASYFSQLRDKINSAS